MNFIEQLKSDGCDVDSAGKRLGSMNLYLRFIRQFPDDKSLESYRTAFESGDFESAFRYIHSLKGLAATFGFTDLCTTAGSIDTALGTQNYDRAGQLNTLLYQQHQLLTALIQTYCAQTMQEGVSL